METSLNAEYIYLPNIGTNLKMALYSKICTFTMQNFERYDKINKVAAILVNFRFFSQELLYKFTMVIFRVYCWVVHTYNFKMDTVRDGTGQYGTVR